jgi:hypothetical protein
MHILTVGKPYMEGQTHWPEAVEYNYRGGSHELRLFYPNLRPQEIAAVESGPARFAFARRGDVIYLCWRFGEQPWSDATYSIHLVPPDERVAPPVWTEPTARALLSVILVEATTGLIEAMRVVSFSPDFTRRLHSAIREQLRRPWPGQDAYLRQLTQMYSAYTSQQIATQLAVATCRGGA